MKSRIADAKAKRPRPVVAVRNIEHAQANIKAKYEFLDEFLKRWIKTTTLVSDRASDDSAALALLPQSARQFNGWTGENLPKSLVAEPFRTNGQLALKNSGLFKAVDTVTKALKDLSQEAVEPPPKLEKLAAAVRRAKIAEELRSIAESELISAKLAQSHAVAEVQELNIQLQALTRESSTKIKELEQELAKERATRAELVRQRSTVTSIHRRKSGEK